MRSGSHLLEYALLGLLALLWGASYLFIKIALATITPVSLIALRVSMAAVILTGLAWMQGHRLPLAAGMWARLGLQAFLNSFGAWTLLAWGQQHVPSGLAGVLNSTAPVFVVLIGLLLGSQEGSTSRRLTGALLGLCGVVLIMGPEALSGLGTNFTAQGAILLSAILYACAALHGRRFSSVPPIVTAAGTMIVATAVLLPAALILDQPWHLSPSIESLGAALALSALCTALALVLYFRLITTLGPAGVASQAYLRAGIAVVLGWLILGERPDAVTLAGVSLAILGVVLINSAPRR